MSEIYSEPAIAITGSRFKQLLGRPELSYFELLVKTPLETFLRSHSPRLVYTGMAIGVDQWAAEVCIANDIPFVACVPFEGQETVWPLSARQKYRLLLSRAHRIELVSKGPYSPQKFQKRNEFMVDHADIVYAVTVSGNNKGGTHNCMAYAHQCGKPIFTQSVMISR